MRQRKFAIHISGGALGLGPWAYLAWYSNIHYRHFSVLQKVWGQGLHAQNHSCVLRVSASIPLCVYHLGTFASLGQPCG